jgi:alkylation response protein AidB-like acyl-CoA dehydrogenase
MMEANARSTQVSTRDDYLGAAIELLPLVEAEADEAERICHQTDKVVAALRRAGIYTMLLPRELGGGELPFVDAMRVVEQIARADGSAGWCAMVGNVMSCSQAHVPEKGARYMYPNGPDTMVAGQGIPRGQARPVEGGYMVRGHWSYGSGIYHAQFAHSGCFVMDGDLPVMDASGAPESIIVHIERKDFELRDNWNVLGLRGTGSYDYALTADEVFIPDYMCYPFSAEVPKRGGNQYTLGLIGFTAWGHTSWALGVGRRVLDELAKIARTKSGPFGAVGESATFKHSFAQAESKYRAARALCYEVWTDLSYSLLRGERATLEQIALIRMAMRHIHDVLSETSTFAHRAGGGVALRPSVLQRCYRDVHAGTQHLLLSDQIFQECGRVMLGMTGAKAHWTILGVVD